MPHRLIICTILLCSTQAISKELPCTFQTREWPRIGNVYECMTKSVDFQHQNDSVSKVAGGLPSGIGYDEINVIYMLDTVCHYMPSGINEVFKNIEGIQIANSGLRSIAQQNLQPFPKLKGLWINLNKIISLDSNLFDRSPLLKVVVFSDNRIRVIPYDIFDPIDDLAEANFLNNICISRNEIGRAQINRLLSEVTEKCQPVKQQTELCDDESRDKIIFELQQELRREKLKIEEFKRKILEFIS